MERIVKVIGFTPDPEALSATGGNLTWKDKPIEDIFNTAKEKGGSKLLNNVINMGHHSVMEHSSFTIAFDYVSVFFEQFLIEHRLAAYSVKSRRYVNYGGVGYYTPKYFRERPELLEKYNEHMAFLFDTYKEFTEKGIPAEDARFLLPYCFNSSIVCTMNARELAHFLYACLHGRGKKYAEVVEIATELKSQVEKIAPVMFTDLKRMKLFPTENHREEQLRALLGEHSGREKSKSVELLSYTQNPDDLVALSAVLNHTQASVEDAKKVALEKKEDLIKIVLNNLRPRELEQINFTFLLRQVSLPILTHITRHRLHALMIPSFTEMGRSISHILPPTIKNNSELLQKFEKAFQKNKEFYNFLKEKNVPLEERIYTYLSGSLVDVVTTMNARELYHFFSVRSCLRAQWEIQWYSKLMEKIVKEKAPLVFSSAGPNCISKKICPEGKNSCGLYKRVGAELRSDLFE